jgi:murein L,D-transpeptidase YcbB/YkuD
VATAYKAFGFAPLWVRDGSPTPQAEVIISRLQSAAAKGLDADNYEGARWVQRASELRRDRAWEIASFDFALTVCAWRYVADLHFGRANPGTFHFAFDLEHNNLDLGNWIASLARAENASALLDSIEPPFLAYRRTEEALNKYQHLASEIAPTQLPASFEPVHRGDRYAGLARIADLLVRFGDLAPATITSKDTYDSVLAEAIRRFQGRHGIEPDGVIGPATLRQLNVPLAWRIRQLELTLERWRWVPHGFPHPPIVVNIPEFELRALDGAYLSQIKMKVVVGKALGHKTPVFSAELKSVVFYPFWEVPLGIARNELLPHLRKDQSYFERHGYQVIDRFGNVIGGNPITGAQMGEIAMGSLRVRQEPGLNNALGSVKFVFPNEHSIYLHDTPSTELFSKSRRDFSHGCIRIEKPEELACWALSETPGWTPERIHRAIAGGETVQVTLARPIPVLIVYGTAIALEAGEVHFFDDIYGEDANLSRQLEQKKLR